jgi:hypothetical protein
MEKRVQMHVRLPRWLHDRLASAAERSTHPIASEIVRRLEGSFRDDDLGRDGDLNTAMATIANLARALERR